MSKTVFLLSAICVLATSSALNASGTIQKADETIRFKNRSECMASLRNDLAQDQAGVTRGRIGMRDGMVKQVSLITHGLVEQSNRVTVYKSELWRSFGGPVDRPGRLKAIDGVSPKMRFSHRYERRIRTCNGKTKTVTGYDGFTFPTFE